MKVILETRRMHLQDIRYPRFHYYHWVNTSAGGQLIPEGIIILVISASGLTYIYVLNTVLK